MRLDNFFRSQKELSRAVIAVDGGRPVYLAMAMDEQNRLKLKPQNLLLNLPLARRS